MNYDLIDTVEELPVKHWAKTILIDNDIAYEIYDQKQNITMVYPKRVIKMDEPWEIKKIRLFTSKEDEDKEAVEFFTEAIIDGEKYTQRFKIYSPHFPRVKYLKQYLGSHIVGANLMCTIESKNSQTHIARYIQIIKKDGLKSNPITRENPTNKQSIYENQLIQTEDYKNYGFLDRSKFKEKFFNDRKDNDIFV